MGYYRAGERPTKNYTVVSNELLQQERLSGLATAMVAYLLSKPDDWRGTPKDIEKRFDISTKARRRATKECEQKGFMRFVSTRDEAGQFEQYYEAFDVPVPQEKRTKSWEYRQSLPTPQNGGSDQPTPQKATSDEATSEKEGSLIKKELQIKEVQKKEEEPQPEKPGRLLTAQEIAAQIGVEYTQDEIETAQKVLFQLTGLAYCLTRTPKMQAYIRNLRRCRGQGAVDKLLLAVQHPDRFSISTTWPIWKIDEALFPDTIRGKFITQPIAAEETLVRAARERLRAFRDSGWTDRDFMSQAQFPDQIKIKAIQAEGPATAGERNLPSPEERARLRQEARERVKA